MQVQEELEWGWLRDCKTRPAFPVDGYGQVSRHRQGLASHQLVQDLGAPLGGANDTRRQQCQPVPASAKQLLLPLDRC